MQLFISDTYEDMSRQAADDVISFMQSIQQPLICTASGDSPAGLYKEIVRRAKKKEADVSDWSFVGLDEWRGLNGDDEGSCRYYLDQQLFQPLGIHQKHICFFNGRATDAESECRQTEDFIQSHGGINVAVVGLGLNGHVGMNEPGTSLSLRSHVADIDSSTQQAGQKYFKKAQVLTEGLTLGLANLLDTHQIFLLVSGIHKADILKRVLEEEPSDQLPASLLRKHPGLRIYADKPAASMIERTS
ncbi:MAG TPA: glucosamine-6-phosphate deaminase [Flavisolibacter sp.]|nr:glucosamine-6-phosphate deaminase [Flavisolibacter sp.]